MKALIDYFIPHVNEGICMAFSGGVDSSVLLAAACRAAKAAGSDKPVLAVTFATRLSGRPAPGDCGFGQRL